MKTLTGILFFLIVISCKAQVIALEYEKSYIEANDEIPDDAYVKDINHILNPYERD